MGNSMYRFLSGGYEYLILLHGLFQLLDQIRCLAFVSFNVLCITVYDDIGNDQQQRTNPIKPPICINDFLRIAVISLSLFCKSDCTFFRFGKSILAVVC